MPNHLPPLDSITALAMLDKSYLESGMLPVVKVQYERTGYRYCTTTHTLEGFAERQWQHSGAGNEYVDPHVTAKQLMSRLLDRARVLGLEVVIQNLLDTRILTQTYDYEEGRTDTHEFAIVYIPYVHTIKDMNVEIQNCGSAVGLHALLISHGTQFDPLNDRLARKAAKAEEANA